MDIVSLIVSLLALIIASVTGYIYLESVVDQTRKEFRENQPKLLVLQISALHSGDILTLSPSVQNVGKVPAYDTTVTLNGWNGQISIGTSYPPGPRFQQHNLSIPLGTDSPIRSNTISPAYLFLRYRDRWGQRYEISYPVTQVSEGDRPFYRPQIDLEHPRLVEPTPTFFEMRKFLRNITLYE